VRRRSSRRFIPSLTVEYLTDLGEMKKSERSSDHKGFKKNIIDLLESYFHKIIGSVDKQDAPGFRDAKEGAEVSPISLCAV
jgi:hypothetical protein